MDTELIATCEGCFYWVKPEPNSSREYNSSSIAHRTVLRSHENLCRRLPQFVARHADDWCGEFQPVQPLSPPSKDQDDEE